MKINHGKFNLESPQFVRKAQYTRGFTLIELLVVVAIVGILATLAMAGYTEFTGKARVARATEEIRILEKQIIAYSTDKATYPPLLDDIDRQNLKDPWGNNYQYHPPGSRRWAGDPINSDFDLYSLGPNGREAVSIAVDDSLDDIIRANDGAFCAMAIKYSLL